MKTQRQTVFLRSYLPYKSLNGGKPSYLAVLPFPGSKIFLMVSPTAQVKEYQLHVAATLHACGSPLFHKERPIFTIMKLHQLLDYRLSYLEDVAD